MKQLHLISFSTFMLLLTGCETTPKKVDPNKIVKLNLKFPMIDNGESQGNSTLKALESVVNLNKTDAKSWSLLAKAYYDQGLYMKAIRAANEAISINAVSEAKKDSTQTEVKLDSNLTEAKQTVFLSSVKLAEINLGALQSSKKFDEDLQNQVQAKIAKFTQASNQ